MCPGAWACARSLAYRACNSYAPYCDVIWGPFGPTMLLSKNQHDFKKVIYHKMCTLFFLQLLSKTFLITGNMRVHCAARAESLNIIPWMHDRLTHNRVGASEKHDQTVTTIHGNEPQRRARHQDRLTDRQTDRLTDWLTDWLTASRNVTLAQQKSVCI